MKDDPAETINDEKDYTFAYTDSYGYEETKETIDEINKKTAAQSIQSHMRLQ